MSLIGDRMTKNEDLFSFFYINCIFCRFQHLGNFDQFAQEKSFQ